MATKKADEKPFSIQMTPLIDVTFLILIFLMVLPFKTLERKIAAFLPTERGLKPDQVRIEVPPTIQVRLRPGAEAGAPQIRLLDSAIGAGEPAFRALDDGIARIHRDSPDLKGEIDADGEVPHSAVVRTLDSFLKAGVTDVTFVGAPNPGRR